MKNVKYEKEKIKLFDSRKFLLNFVSFEIEVGWSGTKYYY
jgi:hypothetical protein